MKEQVNLSGSEITPAERRRIVFASVVGTTIEFYDFYIYATAAVSVFPLLFFPKGEGTAALLASMATFGVAFIARPIGSMLFGHFGDRVGRKATLVGSLLMMGLATFLIGLLPTYHQVGLFAPAMLTILRFCQGLGLGGEWSGAALLALETAEPGKRARAAMWPQLGAPFGFLLANGFFLAITFAFGFNSTAAQAGESFLVWGWRIPFVASVALVLIGLYVRLKLNETPLFRRAVERGERLKSPLVHVLRNNRRELVLGTFAMVATYGLFYLMTTWILSYRDRQAGAGVSWYRLSRFPGVATAVRLLLCCFHSGFRLSRRQGRAACVPDGRDGGDHCIRAVIWMVPVAPSNGVRCAG